MTLNNEMFDGVAGSKTTSLSSQYTVGDTQIVVADATVLPTTTPNILTIIDDDNEFITIRYTTVTNNTITGLTVKSQGTITIFPAGSVVTRNYTYTDDYAIKHNISDLDTRLDAKQDSLPTVSSSGTYVLKSINGVIQWVSE